MISKNFSLEEMCLSETAVRRDIDNTPTLEIIENLRKLCDMILEPLREQLGKGILITSGYRSPFLNQAIGGAKTSQHCDGKAADIHVNGMNIEQLYQFIKHSNLPYSQVIQEFNKWVHISYDGSSRHESLRATKSSDGHTIYAHD